jgi:hypothetical protein
LIQSWYRKQLDNLFLNTQLNERDRLLAEWLAEGYAIDHGDEIIDLIANHEMGINPELWWVLGREIALNNEKALDDGLLSRWVSALLSCSPRFADNHILAWLAARCAKQGRIQLALEIFLFMSDHRLLLRSGSAWPVDESDSGTKRIDVDTPLICDHFQLNEVWEKYIQPHLQILVQPLLSGISRKFENIHHTLFAWERAGRDWDALTWGRSAIERHEQDRFPETIDVLIDAMRDSLEWLAANNAILLEAWIERLINSEVSLLRRLAIHGLTEHRSKSADDQINWLFDRVELNAIAEHHEIHRLVSLAYPSLNAGLREALILKVLSMELPAREDWTAVKVTARAHFDWLEWLHRADPTCDLINRALEPIQAEYPEWSAREHPDLTHWFTSGRRGPESPWTVEELLATPPMEQLEELLAFQGSWFEGPHRSGLLFNIQNACKQKPDWAFQLDEVLSARELWDSDLWGPLLRGLLEAELELEGWDRILTSIARPELRVGHASEIANLLFYLVRDGGKPFAGTLLDQANLIALRLWQSLPRENQEVEIDDWFSKAINHPAGKVVEFWLHGLSLLICDKTDDERTLPAPYRDWFTDIVHDESIAGGLGRCLLASQVPFLFTLDDAWTRESILPMFRSTDARTFTQAWDGFLSCGQLNSALVEEMIPAFIEGICRCCIELPNRRRRFMEFFTALTLFYVEDPTGDLLLELFNKGSLDDRVNFSSLIGWHLRQMVKDTLQNLWERWLRRYWENRLNAIPLRLEEAEVRKMLEWLPRLGPMFPQGARLAVSGPRIDLEHCQLTYDLRESDLVALFPLETAELLIYLCKCTLRHHAADICTIVNRLPPIPADLKRRLNEAMAQAGIDPPND